MEMCESDAQRLTITDGEMVKVTSPVGEVSAKVRVTDTLCEGMLFMPISFSESPVNQLFDVVLNSETKAPSLKACSVMIDKIPLL